MTAFVFAATPVVVTAKVAVVAPAATVAVPGTVAAALPEDKATDRPPVGAGLLIVTVPVEELPPSTIDGFRATAVAVGAATAKVAVTAV